MACGAICQFHTYDSKETSGYRTDQRRYISVIKSITHFTWVSRTEILPRTRSQRETPIATKLPPKAFLPHSIHS